MVWNIMEFCKRFNAKHKVLSPGLPTPVLSMVYSDVSSLRKLKSTPVLFFLRKQRVCKRWALPRPKHSESGTVTRAQLEGDRCLLRRLILTASDIGCGVRLLSLVRTRNGSRRRRCYLMAKLTKRARFDRGKSGATKLFTLVGGAVALFVWAFYC